MTNLARSPAAGEPATRDIVVEEVLPHPPQKVWRALTSAQLIARWLMPNDFEPVVGKRFNFTTKPIGDWDGVVHCEVLEVVPLQRLVHSWTGGSDDNDKYGTRLDSVVTWTLTPVPGGTRVRMVHDRFRSPRNDAAYPEMTRGWNTVLPRIAQIAAELDR